MARNLSSGRNWRYLDARSKRALTRLTNCGYPLQVEIDGELFDIMTYREDGEVFYYLIMSHAIDEYSIKNILCRILDRNERTESIIKNQEINKLLTLDDIIPSAEKTKK